MKTNIEPLEAESFYHIYNRGINGENIFKEERNYAYFLQKYAQYVSPYVSTYAYCLLKNHFHLLVRTRSESEIYKQNLTHQNKDISWILGNAFSSCFKSYTQSINRAYQRTGKLFDLPFRRIQVDNDAYFTALVYYIHHNPQKHGFVRDFRDYPHSSYHSHILTQKTKLEREEVISWFGNVANYKKYHEMGDFGENELLNKFEIEFD